jgi:hypothetical protein
LTAPVGAGFSVETGALLKEAKLWEEQAVAMGDIAKKIDALRFTEMGLLTMFVPRYHVLVDALVKRSQEGGDRMTEIRDTLGYVASLYERTEKQHSSSINSLGQQIK